MGNLTIKKQMLFASFLAIVVFITTTSLLFSATTETRNIELQRNIKMSQQLSLKDARYNIVQIQQFITDASLTGHLEAKDEALENKNKALDIVNKLKREEPQFADDIRQIVSGINELHAVGEEMFTAYQQVGLDAGNSIMTRTVTGFDARSITLSEHFESLATQVDQQASQLNKALSDSESKLKTFNFIASLIQITIIIAICALVLIRVIPAIFRLNSNISQLSRGDKDLSRRLRIRKEDEIGQIAHSVNDFTESLDAIMSAVFQASDRLKNITDGFQHSAVNATDGMKEVHSHTDMLATAITEMSSTVMEVARNTEHAAEIAASTRETTLAGEVIVGESVEIIKTLSTDIDHSASQIQSLVQHSEKIGDIINVIKSISDQTNLLALNAAIEAARAGDAGRGFAVVADEVRSLAKNTQDSAAEIENMISQIQQESQRVAISMKNNIDKAAITVEKAQFAGDSLQEIARSVMELADVNMQIATASEEQSMVSEEINKSILQVANIASDTLAITQKVGLSSIECSFAAGEVLDLSSQFTTSNFHIEKDNTKLVCWSEAYSVHVPSIDAQHRKLFDLMNVVYQLITSNQLDQLTKPLEELITFAKKHLHDEELLLQDANYPDLNAHKQVHKKLLADLGTLYKDSQSGDISKLFELVMFLKNWLLDHIYKVDMKYSEHLVSRGVK